MVTSWTWLEIKYGHRCGLFPFFSYYLATYWTEARSTDATGTNWNLPRLCALRLVDDHSGNMMVEQLGNSNISWLGGRKVAKTFSAINKIARVFCGVTCLWRNQPGPASQSRGAGVCCVTYEVSAPLCHKEPNPRPGTENVLSKHLVNESNWRLMDNWGPRRAFAYVNIIEIKGEKCKYFLCSFRNNILMEKNLFSKTRKIRRVALFVLCKSL